MTTKAWRRAFQKVCIEGKCLLGAHTTGILKMNERYVECWWSSCWSFYLYFIHTKPPCVQPDQKVFCLFFVVVFSTEIRPQLRGTAFKHWRKSVCVCVCVHACMHACVRAYVCVSVCVCVERRCWVNVSGCMDKILHFMNALIIWLLLCMCLLEYVCVYACVYECVHVCVCVCVCMCVCM